ncbi:MAG: hypothetical protein KDD51_16180, partial [Bdellovibrionales bacterium]|nr:hypothetical protein [Bdellovibrionales bacterium]
MRLHLLFATLFACFSQAALSTTLTYRLAFIVDPAFSSEYPLSELSPMFVQYAEDINRIFSKNTNVRFRFTPGDVRFEEFKYSQSLDSTEAYIVYITKAYDGNCCNGRG